MARRTVYHWIFLLSSLTCVCQGQLGGGGVGGGGVVGSVPVNTIYKAASLGGQQVLPCDVTYPANGEHLQYVVQWRKGTAGKDERLLMKIDGYRRQVHMPAYEGRVELVNKASLKISYIQAEDDGWYECKVYFIDGQDNNKKRPTNSTWIFLTVHSPPQIVRSSRRLLQLPRGEDVKIFCEGKGSPEPKITWRKDGKVLNNTRRTSVEGNEVRIVNLQRDDGGIYTCTFENAVGDRSQPIKLVIEGGPYIMQKPGNRTVVDGQRVVFPCETEGYPNTIVYTWLKDDVDIRTTDGFRVHRISINKKGSLVITTAVKGDKGWYTCKPSNGLGHAEASAYLDVVYKPVVLPMPSPVTWALGYVQKIDCPVDANPPMTGVIWVKDQNLIASTSRFDILHNGTLRVSNVQASDAGSYMCTPSNSLGQGLSSSRVRVLVKDKPDPPTFSTRPEPEYIQQPGDTVVMPCHGVGTPAVTTAWSKVWGRFDPSTDDRITLTDTHLEIRALTKDDHGKYECKATNTIATVVTVTELRIENTTPHAPYNVTVLPGHFNVTIRWEPAYDGGTPQHYLLWFRESSPIPMSWVTMSIPSSATRSFKLFSLQPATEYEFKILSRNQLGNGSFSDVVIQSTLAENEAPRSASEQKQGYDRAVVTALPVNRQGQPYYPDVTINHGPQPSAPLNLSARVKDGDILLAWIVPLSSPVPIFSYRIEYSLNGGTVIEHAPLIQGGDTRETSMTGMPSGTYDIRLRSYGVMAYSRVSNIVRVVIAEDGGGSSPSGKAGASSSSSDGPILPEALVGGIVGGVLFLLVSVLLALVAIFHSRRKGRCTKDKKYNDVNYGKPDEVNGRQQIRKVNLRQNGTAGNRMEEEETL